MKKFYTFGPQKFHFLSKMRSFLAITLLLLPAVGNVKAEEVTMCFGPAPDSINTTSGEINEYLSFTTEQNNATNPPAYLSSSKDLRLYYSKNAPHNGCSLTLHCLNGITITAVEITTSPTYTPTVNYSCDGGVATEAICSGNTYTISGVAATSTFMIQNVNSSKKPQLRIKSIKVTYTLPLTCPGVSNLSCTDSLDKSLSFVWVSAATDFNARLNGVDIEGFTPVATGEDNNTKNYTLTGLTPNTEYQFSVKADCEDDYHTLTVSTICSVYEPVVTTRIIPEGTSCLWNEQSYSTEGTYNITLKDRYECDSMATLILHIVSPVYTIEPTVCMGYPYTNPYTHEVMYDGGEISDVTYYDYRDTLSGAAMGGVDSIRIIHLTVYPSYNGEDTRNVCISDLPFNIGPYEFADTLETGTYEYNLHLTTVNGCDSTVHYTLTVNPVYKDTVNATFCANELPTTVGDIDIPADAVTGFITQTFSTVNGCDSTVIVNLTVNPSYNEEISDTICENDLPHIFRGNELMEAGTYTYEERTVNGCDSTVHYTLTVNPVYKDTVNATFCTSELPATVGDIDIPADAVTDFITQTFPTVNGCDSTVTVNLTVNPSYNEEISDTICENDLPHIFRGNELTEAGTYIYTEETVNGCDSTVHYTLTVNPVYKDTVVIAICENDLPHTFRGNEQPEAGTYTYEERTVNGCDSIVTCVLNVHPVYVEHDSLTLCINELPYTYDAGNGHYEIIPEGAESDILQFGYTTMNGCDSTVILDLTVHTTDQCTFTVTLNAGENGSITGPTEVAYKTNADYTISPVDECYYISSLTLDGVAQDITDVHGTTLFIDSIVAHHTIAADFERYNYTITSHVEGSGTITETSVVECGLDTTFTITPNEGYHLDSIMVDGINMGAMNTYTFTDVRADASITAYFSINHYTINMTVVGEEFGTVTPAGASTVDFGDSLGYTFAPLDCYEVSSLTVDGEEHVDEILFNTYFLMDVEADHNIVVTFSKINYPLSFTIDGNGSGTVTFMDEYPEGNMISSVECGNYFYVGLNADEGSHISTLVWGDGTVIENINTTETVVFNNIATAANTHPTAIFNLDTLHVTTQVVDNIGGTVSPVLGWIEYGEDYTLTIDADAENGYHIQTVTCGDSVITLGNNTDIHYEYILPNVITDMNIEVAFALNTYEIAVNVVGEGSVTPIDTVVTHGDNATVTIKADDCYFIDSVIIDGIDQGAISLYDFVNVTASHTLAAYFTIFNYTMTGVANTDKGTVEGGVADCGSDFTYHIETTVEGYHIDHLELDGNTVATYSNHETSADYTVTNVRDNHSLEAFFGFNEYSVTASAVNGTIAPETALIQHGNSQTFTLTPDACQELTGLTVNGEDYMSHVNAIPAQLTEVMTQDFSSITESGPSSSFCERSNTELDLGSELTGWSGTKVYAANTKIGIGSSNTAGEVVLPTTDLSANEGNYVIEFDAMAWKNDRTSIVVKVNDTDYTVSGLSNANNCDLSHFTVSGTGGTDASTIIFKGTGDHNRFFLDNVKVYSGKLAGQSVTVDNITAATEVQAVFSPIQYEMTYTVTGDGSVEPVGNPTNANCGENYTYTLTADTGWHIDNYTIGGTTTTLNTNNDVTAHVDVLVAGDTNLNAVFSINHYTVTATAVSGQGSFDGVDNNNIYYVQHGDNPAIHIAADSLNGYHIASITCGTDIVTLGENTNVKYTYTIENISSDAVVKVEFDLNNYPVTVTIDGEGTVVPTTQDWEYGADATFAITPAEECYYIASVVVDGADVAITDAHSMSYTISGVVDAHTLHVVFADSVFAMTEHVYYPYMGTVSSGEAHCGEDFDYEIHANEGYHISSISLDYAAEPAIDSLRIADSVITVNDIHAPHYLVVDFAQNIYNVTATANDFGTITPSGDMTPNHGDILTFNLAAMNSCYELTALTLNDEDVMDQIVANQFIWTADTDAVITAVFSPIMYRMNVEIDVAGTGTGTVNDGLAECGSDYEYVIHANTGSHIESYTFNGMTTSLGDNADTTATIMVNNVLQDTTLTVLFGINNFTVNICTLDPALGSIEAVSTAATYGHSFDVKVHANEVNGYHIETITCGDSVQMQGANSDTAILYTINQITSDTTVCATFELNEYQITATAGEHGTIEVAGENTVIWNHDTSFVITPAACYYINEVLVDGSAITGYDATGFTYTFTDVIKDHTIDAQFALYEYDLTSGTNDDAMGTVTAAMDVNCGDDTVYVISANHGYHIDSIYLDGERVQTFVYDETDYDTLFTYQMPDVQADHHLLAYFAINAYTIHAENGDHGTINPVGNLVLNHGGSASYTITSDECYYISEVLVDGNNVLEDHNTAFTYNFNNIEKPHEIIANFAVYEYEMTETHSGNGTVTTATVNCGDAYTYTMTADPGWHVEEYTVAETTVHFGGNDDNTATCVINPVGQDTTIHVVFAIDTFDVTVCTTAGGTLTATPTLVDYGSSCDVRIVADTVNGYHIETITCGDNVQVYGANSDTAITYTINQITSDTTICATFELNNYTITATADANSTITPAGVNHVHYGDTVTFTMTSHAPCYYITEYEVDSVVTVVNDSVATTYTFNSITSDHVINVYSNIYTYNMTSTAITEGTVTGEDNIDCGTDYDYVINANFGYHLDSIYLDGMPDQIFPYSETDYTTTYTRTVADVTANHRLDAYFSINTYTITVTAGENGTIDPADNTTLNHGSDITFNVTPDPCHYIDEVLVDGVDVLGGDSTMFTYTFTDLRVPHTFEANFAVYKYEMTETHTGMGTVSTATVDCGTDYTYMIDADVANGFHVENVTFNGITTAYGNNEDVHAEQIVEAVSQDTTIDVVFAINTYSIDVTVNGNGNTVPGDTAGIIWGTDVDYAVQADHGYHIMSVLVDGVEVFTPSAHTNNDSIFNYAFTNIRDNHTFVVTFDHNVYTIVATADAEGSIMMPGNNYVDLGDDIDFTITANGCYHINTIEIDGVADMTFTTNENYYVYNFENVGADHTIHATFAINTYTITAIAGANGTVTPVGTDTVDCGTDAVYTFTPDSGYVIESVIVNGSNIGTPNSYTITNIHNDYTIEVTFTAVNHTLTATSFGHGTITPEGETVVAENGSQVYTLTPDECYIVSEILVNGVSYLNELENNTLTLNNIQADMNIQAYFRVITYNVTTSANEGGAITEGGIVNCGSDFEITITADDCHTIDSVVVNGTNLGAIENYTISAIETDYTVAAYFSLNTYTIQATVDNSVHGYITPSLGTTAYNCGDTVTYNFIAYPGHYISNVFVDDVAQGAISSYSFGPIDANHIIYVEFGDSTYTITAIANVGVTATPALGDTTVDYQADVTYNFTVDPCYEIVDVTVDGESVGAVMSYTFSNITADHIIVVDAVIKTYTITSSVNDELAGTVTPFGETTVSCGGSQNYTITVNEGYILEDVLVNGNSVGAVNSYYFNNVTGDSTIEVVFHAMAMDTFEIVASVRGGNGTINPDGIVRVARGASQLFTMTPDEFYRVFEIYVDSVLTTTATTYTFGNVSANHTIEVVFTAAECPVPTYTWTEDIAETSATLNWTDMNVTSYTVRYKKFSDTADFTEVTGITANTYALSGLEENTDYIWNVKSVCIADEAESDWSSQQMFRTLETVVVDPDDTIGIYEMTLGEMNVYSSGNDIYIVNNTQEQIKDIRVYDLMGRVVYAGNVQGTPQVINMNAANGTYVVRVITEKVIRNYKVSISQR